MSPALDDVGGGIRRFPVAARWVLASTLITNVGNGMHTLAVGWLLYQATGSAAAFGTVMILEYAVSCFFNFFSGPTVDRRDPKKVAVAADLACGAFVCAAALAMFYSPPYAWVLASVVVINLAKPFYAASVFSFGPSIVSEESLVAFNTWKNSLFQVGQVSGIVLAGPALHYLGANAAFGLNGLSFLLAGLAIWAARISRPEREDREGRSLVRQLLGDWKDVGHFLWSNVSFACLLVLSTGDFLAASLVNLSLAPMVDQRFGGNAFWLSAFDGSFAAGAVAAVFVTDRLTARVGLRNAAPVGMAGQAACFLLLGLSHSALGVACAMFAMGAMSGLSVAVLLSSLQRRSTGAIRGRVSSVRYLVTAVLALALIPLITAAQHASLGDGLRASALVCGVFGLATFSLTRRFAFGGGLLGEESSPSSPRSRKEKSLRSA